MDIKACPFCGESASTFQFPDNTQEELSLHPDWKWNFPGAWIVGCETDECYGCKHNMARVFVDENQAIMAWNKRSTESKSAMCATCKYRGRMGACENEKSRFKGFLMRSSDGCEALEVC